MFKKFLLLSCVFGAFGAPAYAQEKEEQFELCPALADEKTYEDDKDFRFLAAGKDGWIFRTDFDFKDTEDYELSHWAKLSFARLNKAFSYNGTKLAAFMIPTRGIVGSEFAPEPYSKEYDLAAAKASYAGLLDGLQNAGMIVADTRDVDTVKGYFLKRDNHWTAIGAKYTAQRVAESIKKDPIYETLPKMEFVTSEVSPGDEDKANDRFLEFIEKVCKQKIPYERLPAIYMTSPKDSVAAGQALLGESPAPEVVLLGTSNSTSPAPSFANFAGYLKESLGVDVQNEAIAGGAFRGSISNYVFQGDYARKKPKLIVWEMSAHYGFDQKPTFREVIPALYGECNGDNMMIENSGTLSGKEMSLFDDLSALNMYGYNYYLYLKLDNKDLRQFKIDFQHLGAKSDLYKMDRSEKNFPKHDGVFFVELKYGIDGGLKMPILKSKEELSGNFVAKMCKVPADAVITEPPREGDQDDSPEAEQ